MPPAPGPADAPGFWLANAAHMAWLRDQARAQFGFFRPSLRPDGGFYNLAWDGTPLNDQTQALHATTRMVHSFSLAHLAGIPDASAMIEHGLRFLWDAHRDADHGGYIWAIGADGSVADPRKLAYGHVFVLLAASSARLAGHDAADRLLADIDAVLETHYWEAGPARFCDEFTQDWTPFSTYRGMNANMHGVEALLTAFEATGRETYLSRAGGILDFFLHRMAADHDWRIPEHYHADWSVDARYDGDPMFRPGGTTPGHSLEWARLALQHWDLAGQPDNGAPRVARALVERALSEAWQPDGGLVYTLELDGTLRLPQRYWWPVTEAIGAVAALIKAERQPGDEAWYRRLWQFADAHFIDHVHGGWFPAIDDDGQPTETQFIGKPDIYHAVQATLFPTVPALSGQAVALRGALA